MTKTPSKKNIYQVQESVYSEMSENIPPIVPMVNEGDASLGEITINNTVVVRIVSLAARQVEGVVSIGGGGFVDKVLSAKGSSGVRVVEDEHENYNITLPVTLEFGMELAQVAYNIQANVRDQVAKMTNKKVARVDVIIEDIKMPEHQTECATPEVS